MQLTVIGICEGVTESQCKIVSEISTNKGKRKLVINAAGKCSEFAIGKLVEYTGSLLYVENPLNQLGEICVFSQLEKITICESELDQCCSAIGEIVVSGALEKNSNNKYEVISKFTFSNSPAKESVMKIKLITDKKELKLKQDTKVNVFGKLLYQFSDEYCGFVLYGSGKLVEKIKVKELNLDLKKICFRREKKK